MLLLSLAVVAVPATTAAAVSDTTPPVLRSFAMSPTSVDTSAAPASITVTARITDDLSGVNYGLFYFYSPSGNQYHYAYFYSGNRISGNSLDGTYQTTMTIPQYAETGTWTFNSGSIGDQVSNTRYYYESDFVNAGFPTTFTNGPDSTPPVLASFAMSPTSVNTSTGSASITVTARITDNASGFNYGDFYFYSPSGNHDVDAYFSSGNRISGTSLDGTYQTTMTIPQYSENGTWSLSYGYLYDQLYNEHDYSYSDFVNAGFPASFTNTSDLTAPVLSSFAMSTTSVNTSTGSASITVTARITDNASGFSDGEFDFYSPSGNNEVYAYFYSGNRISGNSLDGMYQTTMTIPQNSEAGTWTMSYGYVEDALSNVRDYSYSDLVNAGYPASFSNTSAAVPSAPTNVSATAGNQSASVSWSAPSNNGSSISSYTVTASPGSASATVPATQTSATVTGLTNGTSYTFTVKATNGVGTGPASSPSNAVVPGGSGPAIEAPTTGFAFPASLGASSIPAVEKWATASDPNGICSYDLRESVAGGPYNEVSLPTQTSTSVSLSLNPTTSYSFELNVTNCVGQSSGFGVQPSFAPLVWQESNTRLTFSGTWKTQSVAGSYGGGLKYSTAKNASVIGAFFAEGIAWASETGPTMGKATVYIDGVAVKTVDLYSRTVHESQIVWKMGWSGTQVKHTIKIVAKGTAGRPRVDLDAILTFNIP